MSRDRRRALISIGKKLFSKYGYRDVNVEAVTKEAGLSTGSFYNYFSSKEAFYEQIIDDLEAQGIREADRIVSRLKSPVNRLKALYHFTTLGVRHNEMLRGLLIGDERYIYPGSEERLHRKGGLRAHLDKLIKEIIEDGRRTRVLRTGLFKDPQRMLVALYNTILISFDDEGVDDMMSDILLLIERGLKRRLKVIDRNRRHDRRKIRKTPSRELTPRRIT